MNLQFLNLAENDLSGSLPPELGGLTNLRDVMLSPNEFSGCIPEGLRDTLLDFDVARLGLPYCN